MMNDKKTMYIKVFQKTGSFIKPKRGMKFIYLGDVAKVLAYVDDYVVAQKKGCEPFLVHASLIQDNFCEEIHGE